MPGVRSRVDEKDPPWWRDAVISQLYPRSFAGGQGDGGLSAATARLEQLSRLGTHAVRVSCPGLGMPPEATAFVHAAHRLGLRVLLDLVTTHCSHEHPWFIEALAAPPGSPSRRRFWFRDGRGPNNDRPPNDWVEAAGGPAWSRVVESDGKSGQWYLHLFEPQQPDLCWDHPQVRAELGAVIRSWFDHGVDGLRVDAAAALTSALVSAPDSPVNGPLWDVEGVHDVLREWRAIAGSYDEPRLLLASGPPSDGRLSADTAVGVDDA